VQDQEIKLLGDHVDMTNKKVESGSATNFDSLTTKVKVAEAQSQKIELQNLLDKASISFKRLLGDKGNEPISLKGDFSQIPPNIDESSLVNAAMERRAEVKVTKDFEKTSEMGYRVARSEYNPALDLNFIYGGKNGYESDLNEIRQDYTANIEIKFPLFEGFKTPGKVKEAKAKLMVARMNRLDAEQMVASEVKKAISDVNAAQEKIDSTKLHVKLAEEALSQAKIRYQSGVITNLDLINAETSLAQARLLNIQSMHDYVISAYALKKAAGEKLWD
jgi:outer membrane protein